MSEGAELVSTNASSARTAIIDLSGSALWLYLTAPGSAAIESDCWLANVDSLAGAPSDRDRAALREAGLPPPAPPNALADPAQLLPVEPGAYRLEWSADGEAVQALLGEQPIAFVQAGSKRGHHLNIATDCPWGRVFDTGLYRQLFGASARAIQGSVTSKWMTSGSSSSRKSGSKS